MQPGDHVATRGDSPAVIMAPSGTVVTYAELDERSKRLARLLRSVGLRDGDHIAVILENDPRYFEVFWGAMRAGLCFTPINWHLTAAEAGYIVEDCGARAVITSAAVAEVARDLAPSMGAVTTRLVIGGDLDGWDRYETELARHPAEALDDEVEGVFMFYSSGTTGRPKGIEVRPSGARFGEGGGSLTALIQGLFGFTDRTTYLNPAPLYHAAPLGWTTAVQRLGGTVVCMEAFDPVQALDLIEAHAVTHAQFVPTHFIRMLKLADDERTRADLSSLQVAVHAAAPCPVEVKRQMLDWWGPIIHEYYAGSEGNGFCAAGPEDWLAHPGTVGRPLFGVPHILDPDGRECPTGQDGQIWFETETSFAYHNDPEKTREVHDERGWSTLGDVGHLDDDGFLHLTDRVSHMIISGGVNIYPQEVEDALALHPAIADVAVIGVPDPDLGEQVKAVVVADEGATPGDALAEEIMASCRTRLARFKCPRSVDFVDELPRLESGKLLKRRLRDAYAAAAAEGRP